MARKDYPESRFNTPGPTPGPKGAVRQSRAAASGYELPKEPRCVNTHQAEGSTGETHAPGLTTKAKKGRK